jgi:hypothetical protein
VPKFKLIEKKRKILFLLGYLKINRARRKSQVTTEMRIGKKEEFKMK